MSCDGAFHTRRFHTAIVNGGGTAVISNRKNGRLWEKDAFGVLPVSWTAG